MAEKEPRKNGRPANPKDEKELQKLLKGYTARDIPAFRRRLRDIALGLVKDSQYDAKTGKIIEKPVPLSVCVDAINSYGKNILAKVQADVKPDTGTKPNDYTATDAVKAVEAKKRVELEAKAKKEAEEKAKAAGKLVELNKAQGGN